MLDPSIAPAVSAALMRISARNAFFGALALFARVQTSEQIPTAATDGRDLFLNTGFFAKLTPDEQDGLLLHEVLHAALLHVPRRLGRDPKLWNIAADIMINGLLVREGYSLPAGGLRDASLEHLAVEEIYEMLLRKPKEQQPEQPAQSQDLLSEAPGDAADSSAGQSAGPADQSMARQAQQASGEDQWRQAQEEARQIAESSGVGSIPGQMRRELEMASAGRLDWRSLLWRYLTRTAVDFQGFDRRYLGQGMYLDALDGESLRVALAVDTSGSINIPALQLFVGEVQRILGTYPHLICDLYYADSKLYGPHRLHARAALPTPQGGGGTDFRPFFTAITKPGGRPRPNLAIYLTDGYGSFPKQAPHCPTLWVVTPGGRDMKQFPFGQTVRLLPSAPRARWMVDLAR